MGLSSNQARFLSLTARQVDLEHRVQQICQRRLRLASELENVATQYNNSISNRKLFIPTQSSLENINLNNLKQLGFRIIDENNKIVNPKLMKSVDVGSYSGEVYMIKSAAELQSALAGDTDLNGKYILTSNINMSELGVLSQSFVNGTFNGTFEGNGYEIENLSIFAASGSDNIGFFSQIGSSGSIKNVVFSNAQILIGDATSADRSTNIAIVAGVNNGILDNVALEDGLINVGDYTNKIAGLVGFNNNGDILNSYAKVDIFVGDNSVNTGGLIGENTNASNVENCFSEINISTGNIAENVGGIIGGSYGGADMHIENTYTTGSINLGDSSIDSGGFIGTRGSYTFVQNCFSEVDITTGTSSSHIGGFEGLAGTNTTGKVEDCASYGNVVAGNSSNDIGGFTGNLNNTNALILSSISTGSVTVGINSDKVGGFIGNAVGTGNISDCYTSSNVAAGAGSTLTGGFSGNSDAGIVKNTNYYLNNLSASSGAAIDAHITTPPLSVTEINELPAKFEEKNLEESLRNGTYSLARESDIYSQSAFLTNDSSYEEVDWRVIPMLYDELYKGDDADAENKYEITVSNINAQDKKLQLEQSSVEVEYKAVASEKDAVKKILDTNATSSFKYFG